MLESEVVKNLRLRLTELRSTSFRQNVGMAWAGSKVIKHPNGSVTILDARPVHIGLVKGSSDLIGWTPVTIEAAMIGREIAVFTAIEAKASHGHPNVTKEQKNFIAQVKGAGGIAGVAKSAEMIDDIFAFWFKEIRRGDR